MVNAIVRLCLTVLCLALVGIGAAQYLTGWATAGAVAFAWLLMPPLVMNQIPARMPPEVKALDVPPNIPEKRV